MKLLRHFLRYSVYIHRAEDCVVTRQQIKKKAALLSAAAHYFKTMVITVGITDAPLTPPDLDRKFVDKLVTELVMKSLVSHPHLDNQARLATELSVCHAAESEAGEIPDDEFLGATAQYDAT
jgi:hypothetical protein